MKIVKILIPPEKYNALLSGITLRHLFLGVAKKKLSKKRSSHAVNEHFETIFNAAIPEKILRTKLSCNFTA